MRQSRGFTLIEMLVIAPIAIIMIAGFIGLMIRMTGDVITSQQRTVQIYNTQNALDGIEQDINHAGLFASSIPSGSLTTPQGSGNNSAAWNASPGSSVLILQEYATTENPLSNSITISPVYTATPNNCYNYPDYTYNKPYYIYVVYFLRKPAGATTDSLWRRTILPPISPAPCSTPYQRNSCFPGAAMNGAPCKTADEEVLDDVSAVSFDYYLQASDTTTTSDMQTANTIGTTLTTTGNIAGNPYSYTSDLRATRLNSTQ